jgi:hypothetical protein
MSLVDLFAPLPTSPISDERYRIRDGARMRPYQLRAAHKIFCGQPVDDEPGVRDGTAVHIDPGLGKTITALTAIVEWFRFGVISKPVLLIAPIKVCETVWRQEAGDWSHTRHLTFQLVRGNEKERAFALSRQTHVVLINPELLMWLQKYVRTEWGQWFDALIIDESSMFKDNRSKRFRVLSNYGTRMTLKGPDGKSLHNPITGEKMLVPPHRFKRSAILTGTPSPSGQQNLWSPFYLIDHGKRLHTKFDTFQGRYFHKAGQVALHIDKYEINPGESEVRPEWQARDGAPERIHELIADITIELNAGDHGILPKQLPPFKHYIDLPDELKPHYLQLEREAVFEMLKDPILASNGGAISMMCWQLCNGAIYSTDQYGRKEWTEVHTRKVDKLVELIDELDQHALIPYHFNHDLERIVTRFKKEGIPYAVLTSRNSESVIDRWNKGQIPNLLIHPQSAGHGINLQFGGHTLIWFSTIWSLERYLQTNARVARSGQKEIVGIHVIIARNTTDEVRYNSWFERGDDMQRFREATLKYQLLRGMDVMALPELAGGDPWKGITL